jgi:hypothetical protein
MGAYVTDAGLSQVLDQGFSLQQSRVKAQYSIPVAYLNLAAGQVFRLRWLSVHLIRVLAPDLPAKVNPGLGSVYAGFYEAGAGILTAPGQPLAYTPVDVPGVNQTSPYFYHEVESTGTYLILLVNNLAESDVDVACSGAFRVMNFTS